MIATQHCRRNSAPAIVQQVPVNQRWAKLWRKTAHNACLCDAAVQAAIRHSGSGWMASSMAGGDIISMLYSIIHKCTHTHTHHVILSVFLHTAFSAFTLVEPCSASAPQAFVCFLLPCACINPVSTAPALTCVCSPYATAANSINFDVCSFDQLLLT